MVVVSHCLLCPFPLTTSLQHGKKFILCPFQEWRDQIGQLPQKYFPVSGILPACLADVSVDRAWNLEAGLWGTQENPMDIRTQGPIRTLLVFSHI